jgi:dolichol kinase
MGQAPAFQKGPFFPLSSGQSGQVHAKTGARAVVHPAHALPADLVEHSGSQTPRKLTRSEFFRRLVHFGPGLVALMLAQAPGLDSISLTARICIVVGSLALSFTAYWYQKSYSRSHEKSCLPAILGYIIPVLLVLCLFPDFPELALMLIGIMAFGDGSATLFGLLYGSKRLPWNREKTWVGTIAFVVAAVPIGALVYLFTASPEVSPGVAFLCAGTAAVCAAAVESLPVKGNDNFRVCTAAMAGVLVMHALLVGF